jgi:hypothetical protein
MLTTILNKKELKTQLVEKIEKFDYEKLLLIHQFISTLIGNELINSVSNDWQSEHVNKESIKKAIQEHRRIHPYGDRQS